jgi:hypothetical protein
MMRAGLRTRKIAYTGFSTQLSLKGYKSFVNILIDSFRKTFFACLSSSMCQFVDKITATAHHNPQIRLPTSILYRGHTP